MYVYYQDPDTSQWVDASPQGGGDAGFSKLEVGNSKVEVIDTGTDGQFVVTTEGSERLRVGPAGQVGLGGTNYGTSGQVITSNGTGAAPTWQSVGDGTKIEVGNTKAEVTDTGSNGTFTVTTEGTARLTVNSTGRTLLGGVTANANGGVLQLSSGITFPATQVAATDPNTLDDYEEGTFTPVIADATTGGTTSTGGTVDGRYLKIGKWVTCTINCYNFSTSGMTAGNNFYVRGLPFNVQTTGAVVRHIGAAVAERCNLSTNSMTFQVPENTSYGIFVQNGGSGASARTVIVSDFSSGNSYFRTTIAYETA
jgi:hypothetical protein